MKRENWILLLVVGVIGVVVVVGFLKRSAAIREHEAAEARPDPFTAAKEQALDVIRERAVWPESPVAVCKAYWVARTRKDYAEMAVLWPGCASLDLAEMCKDDLDTQYVFAEASADGIEVPYATKGYYDANKRYNFTMHLSVLDTDHGPRHYVMSPN